ncbi:uncharacterized protein LOC144113309 isoform X2 [Amblyomma americanum]
MTSKAPIDTALSKKETMKRRVVSLVKRGFPAPLPTPDPKTGAGGRSLKPHRQVPGTGFLRTFEVSRPDTGPRPRLDLGTAPHRAGTWSSAGIPWQHEADARGHLAGATQPALLLLLTRAAEAAPRASWSQYVRLSSRTQRAHSIAISIAAYCTPADHAPQWTSNLGHRNGAKQHIVSHHVHGHVWWKHISTVPTVLLLPTQNERKCLCTSGQCINSPPPTGSSKSCIAVNSNHTKWATSKL